MALQASFKMPAELHEDEKQACKLVAVRFSHFICEPYLREQSGEDKFYKPEIKNLFSNDFLLFL